MYKAITRSASVLALVCLPFSASALSITVTKTTLDLAEAQTNFQSELDKLKSFIIEDFEDFSLDDHGQADFDLDERTLSTRVGDLVFSGTEGGGDAVDGDPKSGRIIQATEDDQFFGRFNTSTSSFEGGSAAGDHNQYLDTNDVQTMTWSAFDRDNPNNTFDRLLFSVTDFADQGATFQIKVGENYVSDKFILSSGAKSGEIRNFVVAFSDAQTSADVIFSNIAGPNITKDGGGFDNMTLATIPLPAALWLLFGVSGALVVAKRRSLSKAA